MISAGDLVGALGASNLFSGEAGKYPLFAARLKTLPITLAWLPHEDGKISNWMASFLCSAKASAFLFPDESGISPEGVAIGGRLPEGHLVAVIAMTDFED